MSADESEPAGESDSASAPSSKYKSFHSLLQACVDHKEPQLFNKIMQCEPEPISHLELSKYLYTREEQSDLLSEQGQASLILELTEVQS